MKRVVLARPERIFSLGRPGAEEAALAFARTYDMYQEELHDPDPSKMFSKADGTIVLTRDRSIATPSMRALVRVARDSRKPFLLVHLDDSDAWWRVETWVKDQNIKKLHLTGPEDSISYFRTLSILSRAFDLPEVETSSASG